MTDKEPWIELASGVYPEPHEEALWYDAMFDRVMVFALLDPTKHDGDFTHWMPRPASPKKYANRKHAVPIVYYQEHNFIKENRMKWLYMMDSGATEEFRKGAYAMLNLVEQELKRIGRV